VTWLARLRRRSRPELLGAVLMLGGLTLFVALTYVVIVLGGGALVGHTSSPQLGLSVLATAVVALGFDPVQTRLESVAARVVHGGQPSPYDVLRRFSETLAGSHAAEEVPARMARVLANGTGGEWAQVWIVVGDRPILAATWPPDARRDGAEDGDPREADHPGRRSLPVRHGDDLLGVLVVQERPRVPLTSVEERLFAGMASQAGLVLRGVRLRAELELRLEELSTRAGELRASRQRVVDAQDAARRRLERDIHDGAQQHLVALAVNLSLAGTLAGRAPERADDLLAAQEAAAEETVATLVRLSRGIYPPLLGAHGPGAALRAAVEHAGVPVLVDDAGVGRYPPIVEAAAYFCCLEAVQNATKHAGSATIRVTLRGGEAGLGFTVEDDGAGYDPATTPPGAGLANMRDRVESLGGTLTADSQPGGGTRIRAELPAPSRGVAEAVLAERGA
jgi:signal transduction histidine kinase